MGVPTRKVPLISILVPVYNEERNIRPLYEAVTQEFAAFAGKYDLELLFTDNHSTDGTARELKKLAEADQRVKVVRFARNFGFQRSVLTAYRMCSGDAAVQIDCDLQDPPELIKEFLSLWEQGHDVVVGIRRNRQESILLTLGRRFFYWLVTVISDDNIIRDAGDFRLVDRSVIEQLKHVNDVKPYTRGLISSLAARQTGLVYDRRARLFEKSKFPIRRLTGFATDGIVNHSLMPLRLAGYAGFFIFMCSFLGGLFYLGASLFAGRGWPPGFATLTLLILLSIGLNGVFIGILGEYVGRIYDQTRSRPITIIEKTINIENPAEA